MRLSPAHGGAFTTTHWSVIMAASQADGLARENAMAALCQSYWLPVYAYVRRRGHKPEDAQDLTQEFFTRLLAKEWLSGLEPRVSRFRSFLLTAVSCFLANEYDRATAAKRGGGALALPLDEVEALCWSESANLETPEHAYDRRWALTVMDQALARLRQEAQINDKLRYFDGLSPFLSREPTAREYDAVAGKLGLAPGAVGVAVLRLRRRYREVVREVITATVGEHEDVEDELRYLIEMLRR